MAVSHLLMKLSNTMQLLFDHTLGKQENSDIVMCRPMATIESGEEAEALDGGWLALDHPIHNREVFYQSRSTRIDLNLYKPKYKAHEWQGEPIKIKIIDASEMVRLLGLPHIYKKYMAKKKFTQDYDPFRHYHRRDQFMLFYTGTADNIIAFTKQKRYYYQEANYVMQLGDPMHDLVGVESVIHANTVPISAMTLDIEISWAMKNHVAYFYMGSGYEESSIYKADFKGFQWWTGTKWSSDKKMYKSLCRRDSKIDSLTDVASLRSLIREDS